LDVENNYFEQTDKIYDTLVTRAMMLENHLKTAETKYWLQKSHTDNNPNLKITNILSSASAELYVKRTKLYFTLNI